MKAETRYEGDYDVITDILSRDFVADMLAVARRHVENFFLDKSMYCGGPIPKNKLYSNRRVSSVANTDVSTGVDLAYVSLEKAIDPAMLAKAEKFGLVTSDIKLVQQTLNTLCRSKVPMCLAGGILLMYLEFCEGVKF